MGDPSGETLPGDASGGVGHRRYKGPYSLRRIRRRERAVGPGSAVFAVPTGVSAVAVENIHACGGGTQQWHKNL